MREVNREELKALVIKRDALTDAFYVIDVEFNLKKVEFEALQCKWKEAENAINRTTDKIWESAEAMVGMDKEDQLISSVEAEVAKMKKKKKKKKS